MLGGFCILAIAGLMSFNALLAGLDRGLGGFSPGIAGVYGTEEIVSLLASVAALTFFPFCHLCSGHIAVGVVMDLAPARIRRVNALLAHLLACGTALFLGWWMALGTVEAYRDRAMTSLHGLPQWPFYLPGVISMALWAVVAAQAALSVKGDLHGPA